METMTANQTEKRGRKQSHEELGSQDNQPLSVQTPQEKTLLNQSQSDESAIKKTHFVLQKKGGVGKSVVALMITQYLRSIGKPVAPVDTDPSNATLYSFKALNGHRIQLMDGTVVNEAKFDLLMNRVLSEDTNFVIDCGASSFIPLNNYMMENRIMEMITDNGKQMVAHTVIVGHSHLMDTITSFADLVEQMPEKVQIVVWLNEHFGEIKAVDGTPFDEMKVFQENKHRIHGIVSLPKQNHQMAGADMEKMLTSRLTFDEVRQSPEFDIMNKSRIYRVQQEIYRQLKAVL